MELNLNSGTRNIANLQKALNYGNPKSNSKPWNPKPNSKPWNPKPNSKPWNPKPI